MYGGELILWAEGKRTVTLLEYKAVRQTGRDPTWNVLGVLSEKMFFFLNKAFADCKCIPDVYEPKKMYSQISKSYLKRRTLCSSYDSAGGRLEVIVQIRSAHIIRQSSLSK